MLSDVCIIPPHIVIYYCIQIQDADGVYGVVLIAPSATTFGHINPSFRIYTMDTSTMTLLGYEQYYLNVTLANGEIKSTGHLRVQQMIL